MLRLKAEESLYDVFGWREGDFRFLDSELPVYEMVPLAIDVTRIVLEGLAAVDEWLRIREAIPSPRAIPVRVDDFAERELGAGAAWCGAGQTISARSRSSAWIPIRASSHVCRLLFSRLQERALKVVHPRAGRAPAPGGPDGAVDAATLLRRRAAPAAEGWEAAAPFSRRARASIPTTTRSGQRRTRARRGSRRRSESGRRARRRAGSGAARWKTLTRLPLSPPEGFLLTRVDGKYDVASMQKISPMSSLEGLLVFPSCWRPVTSSCGPGGRRAPKRSTGLSGQPGRGRETCGLPRSAKRSGQPRSFAGIGDTDPRPHAPARRAGGLALAQPQLAAPERRAVEPAVDAERLAQACRAAARCRPAALRDRGRAQLAHPLPPLPPALRRAAAPPRRVLARPVTALRQQCMP